MEHWYDGWDEKVLPNETLDEYGQIINTETKKGFGQPDKTPLLPTVRKYDHPTVNKLREYLRVNNKGIHGLEMCEPNEIDKATSIFHRDGFVVVKNLLTKEQCTEWKNACDLVLKDILAYPGQEGRRFTGETGRLHGRYSYGTSSASRQMLHNEIWAKNVALPTIIPLIERMYGSYIITGAGGDLCIPGAFEYQHLHRDALPRGEPEFKGKMAIRRMNEAIKLGLLKLKKNQNTTDDLTLNQKRLISEMMPMTGTINFVISDLTFENGPIRQIPGTHTNVQYAPTTGDEPEFMRLSTCAGVPAGSGIFRDHRCWHGATPNVSNQVRHMPNIEWQAGWVLGETTKFNGRIPKTMPYDIWEQLSPYAKNVCRHVVCKKGVKPTGAGIMHPLASKRREIFNKMSVNTNEKSADEFGSKL